MRQLKKVYKGCINIHDTVIKDLKNKLLKKDKMNNVTISGRLAKDPECKELKDNKAVCDLTIAVNGYRKEDTVFIKVKAWDGRAKSCSKFCKRYSS